MSVFYNTQRPYVDPETNVVYAKTWQEVDIGQKPSLKRKEDEVHILTASSLICQPGWGSDSLILGNSSASRLQGSPSFASDPASTPILYFDTVSPDTDVLTQFTPIVSAYVTSQYQQGQIMKNGVEVKPIRTAEMSSLKETTVLVFSQDKTTGEFHLGPALMI
ncbi:hypothetical protein FRB91_002974 [Serendipita sp. 411]|nr:hypothetical protein FRB91_002974 [Serendipita sp. 411]